MKRILIIITVLFSFLNASALDRDSLWLDAVNAYSTEDYEKALEGFLELEDNGYLSADLYYNIGNSYFKIGVYNGHAILYYERALKLNPSSEDIKHNLVMAQQFSLDKIEMLPEFVLVTWVRSFGDIFSSNQWAYLSLGLFALMAFLLVIFRFGRSEIIRRISFILAIIVFLFSIFSFLFALNLKNELDRDDKAVIINPVSSVRSSPSDSGKSLFLLHEGTKVEIIEELGTWTRVELSDGRQGWILKRDIEII